MRKRGFFKRGKTWWFRTDPLTGKPSSSGFKDYRAAELEFARRERAAADPAYAAASQASLEVWCQRLLTLKRNTKAAGTVEMYEQKLGHVLRIFGDGARMADVTPEAVSKYFDQRTEEGASTMTLAKELTAIFQVCKLAQHGGAFALNVAALRPPGFSPAYKPRERFLTREEFDALLRSLPPRRAAWVALFVATGGRLSEGYSIRPEDVDLKRATLRIRGTKTADAARVVPILDVFRPLIEAAVPWLPLAEWKNLYRDLDRACERAGIASVTTNDLRRTTATWLWEAGVDLAIIARILGHKDTTMLQRVYGKARPEALGKLANQQIASTDSSHREPLKFASGGKGPVAQSAELRIFNPVTLADDWAEIIGDVSFYAEKILRAGPADAAQCRPGKDKNVTVLLPPAAARAAAVATLEGMAGAARNERLVATQEEDVLDALEARDVG